MSYSKQVIEHFRKPHNQGVIKNADAVGKAGNPICGDVMKIYLKIQKPAFAPTFAKAIAGKKATARQVKKSEEIIKDIKFETLGCAAAIAVSSAMTDMVKGLSLDDALRVTKDQIVKKLGGLPAPKIHCSMLGTEALAKAIESYKKK